MKAQMILIFVFVFGCIFSHSQTTKVERTTSPQLMKLTQFHDNGEIAQQGHIHRNKLDGVWESFDAEGNKIAVGNYENGVKAGTWFFWTVVKNMAVMTSTFFAMIFSSWITNVHIFFFFKYSRDRFEK